MPHTSSNFSSFTFRFVLFSIVLQQTFQDKLFHLPIRPLLVTSNIPTFILNINNSKLCDDLEKFFCFRGLKFTIASAPQIKYKLAIEVPSLTLKMGLGQDIEFKYFDKNGYS
jgi:hypothetical protein